MQWPIYTGGRTKALEQAATAEQSATGKDLESARADLRLETTRAFWALVTATESVSVVDESVKRIEAQLGDVRARFDAGFLPPNDVLTVESRVSSQRTLLIQAKNQRDGSRAELARLMGVPVDASFEVDAVLADTNLPTRPTRPALALRRGKPRLTTWMTARTGRRWRCASKRPRLVSTPLEQSAKPSIAFLAGYDYARPNPRHLPAGRHLAGLVGPWRQRHLHVVERRAYRRAGGRGALSGRRRRASAWPRPTRRSRSRFASDSSISGRHDRRSKPPAPRLSAPPRPVASSPSASGPVWRRRIDPVHSGGRFSGQFG